MENRNTAKRELDAFLDEFNYYSIGEALYSILRLNEKGLSLNISEVKNLKDKDIYKMINKAKKIEALDYEG